MSETKKPIVKLRDRGLSVAIWQNSNEEGAIRYSTSFEKQYMAEDESWKVATSYSEGDLLRIARLFAKAYDAITELKQAQ